MSTRRITLALVLGISAGGLASTANASYFTPYVSEEGGGPATFCTAWNEGMMGFKCTGNYCDNVSMKCNTLPNGMVLDSSSDYWSSWFSEEWDGTTQHVFDSGWWWSDFQSNYQVCHYDVGGIVSGMRCSGSNCDNMSLECDVVKRTNGTTVRPTNCAWLGTYSDEQPAVDFNLLCGSTYFVAGVKCAGRYCDNMSFLVCSYS